MISGYLYVFAFRLLGTPTEENWPGVTSLPYWNEDFPTFQAASMSAFLSSTPGQGTCPDTEAIDLIEVSRRIMFGRKNHFCY
jgi:hypothetical protein